MDMKITAGDSENQLRVIRTSDSMLVGLISRIDRGWRVELFMRIDATCTTKEEAVAFVQGCVAMTEAYTIFRTRAPKPMVPTVESSNEGP